MKNIISIVVLMITLFSTSVIQAVETKYVPSTSQAVFSIKLNELSTKAEISLQKTLIKCLCKSLLIILLHIEMMPM